MYLNQHKNDTAPKQEQNTAQPQQEVPKGEETSVTSDNNTVSNDSTVDYQTESGKPINEAEEREFIVKPNGDKNFGEISQEIETKN